MFKVDENSIIDATKKETWQDLLTTVVM